MKKILYIIFTCIFLTACNSGALSLKKNNSDEFLVEKKSPLVMPPDYGKLPKPGVDQIEQPNNKENKKLNKILINNKKSSSSNKNSKKTSIEKSILKKIE